MKTICRFKRFNRILLLFALSSLHPGVAGSFGQPTITSALTDCEKYYLIQIFENGRVEYRGGWGVKALGRRQTQISQQALTALLKKIESTESLLREVQTELPATLYMQVILLHQHDREVALRGDSSLIDKLRIEIIRMAKLERWIGDLNRAICLEHHAIRVNNLKIKQ
ncbi:MAG: hypothetical protein ACXVA0_23840 [Mucilaginibacter sp.]